MKTFSHTILAFLAVVSLAYPGSEPLLPESLSARIKQILRTDKLLAVDLIYFRSTYPLQYIGVSVEIPSAGFEGVSYQQLIFRRKSSDKDWSTAIAFRSDSAVNYIFSQQDSEIDKLLIPIESESAQRARAANRWP